MDIQKWIVAGILVAALTFAVKNHQALERRAADYERSLASQTDSCSGKKLCLVVYMAPWCPACKQVLPQVTKILDKSKTSKEFGTKIYIGKGETPADDTKMAKQIGAGAITDTSLEMHKKLKIGYYPTFLVLDSEGSVILNDKDAYYWAMEKIQ